MLDLIQEIFNYSTIMRLLGGLWLTLEISFISITISILGGLFFGILMSLKKRYIYFLCRFCLEFVRVMPLIVWLFVVYFGLARWLGMDINAFMATVIVFSIWGVFEMMDLVRSALQSIPKHQYESASSLGLSKPNVFIFVIIPQILRRLTPMSMNLFTRMIKSTTFAYFIGVIELFKVAQQIIELHRNEIVAPFLVFGLVFFIYFIICYFITLYSKYLERKWS
ncbi:amino acid ABC transporter permease [Campylobacter sp. CCS1377]|uniref:Amino acid ABC transporter permease n=1 Tax=Campylobacter sp. CCS1377 TaxID=3158229 RepID=A0AAU7EAX1_9BACT|nr:amino acid ABC transporter permease [Campylobacter jejuni]